MVVAQWLQPLRRSLTLCHLRFDSLRSVGNYDVRLVFLCRLAVKIIRVCICFTDKN